MVRLGADEAATLPAALPVNIKRLNASTSRDPLVGPDFGLFPTKLCGMIVFSESCGHRLPPSSVPSDAFLNGFGGTTPYIELGWTLLID